jgi:hypothetical protein
MQLFESAPDDEANWGETIKMEKKEENGEGEQARKVS